MLRKPMFLLFALPLLLSACTGTTDTKPDDDGADTDVNTDTDDPDGLALPILAVSPADPRTADDLVASVTNLDPAATYVWAWTVNGANQSDLRSETVPAARTARNDSWCVAVVASKAGNTVGPVQTCLTIGNTPPVATVDLTPDLATSGDPLQAVLTSTDADGDPVTYTYTWEYQLDAVTMGYTGGEDGTVPTAALAKDQIWTVSVVPNDGFDDGEPTTDSVTIVNSPPIVLSADISPSAPTTGTLLTANANAVDPDGDTGLRYTYTWYRNDPTTPVGTGATLNGLSKFDKGDDVWFTVEVADRDDTSAPFESDHVTILNTAPELDSASLTPTTAGRGTTLTCVPSGWTDADLDAEGYHYQWRVDGVPVSGASSSTLSGAFVRGQAVGCVAAPFDGETEGVPQSSNTVTIGNTPPVIGGATLSSLAPALTDTLSVRLTNVVDVDGDAPITYSYQWFVRNVPVPAPTGTGATLAGVFAPGDRVYVQVTASDGLGLGAAVSSNIAIAGNHKPTADSVSLAPNPAKTDDTLTATAAGSDVDGHPVTFKYRWRVNNVTVPLEVTNRLAGSFFVKGDKVDVTATPNDGYEDGLPRTAGPLTIVNSAPTLGGVSLSPAPAFENTVLSCVPSGFADADGDPENHVYAWTVGGAPIAAVTSTLTGASFGRGDQVRCTVTPFDGTLSGPAISSDSVTIANTKPTLVSATISPATPHTGDTITMTPSGAADLDGDTVTFYTEWFVDGVVVAQGPTLAPSRFRPGKRIVARVSPLDGSSTGTSVMSNELVVANTDPVITSFTVAPATPTTQDTLTTSIVTSDLDSDPVSATYAWTVNGLLDASTSASTFPATSLKRDDVISVVVTVVDGQGGQATASAGPVTVRNTAPVIGSVAVSPADPTEVSVLSCDVSGVSDVDADTTTVSVEWRVNGAVAGTSPTLDGSAFRRGDGVLCVATASDGSASSPGMSSLPVIVANTPPTLASAEISDPAPTASSLLVINAGATADVDGDTVSLEVDWYVNDVFASSESGLLGGFARGDVVTAVVTPTDGVTPGAAVTTSPVTVLNSVPGVLSVVIGPSNPTQADTLVANVVSSDADNDPLTFTYEWYIGTTVVQSGPLGTLAPGAHVNGSVVHVVVTADDGADTSAPLSSGMITVGNAAPTITSVTISPNPILETSTPSCVPSGWNDVDGDPEGYLYKWKINSVVRSVNPTINGLLYKRFDVIVCEVTPYDGKAYGTPMESAPVTVANTPPVLVGVGLSNTSPREGDIVSAYVAGVSDPDGDSVTTTVTWFVDDAQVLVGPTLNGTYFDKGQTIRASVALFDGAATATFPTDTGLVINTVPRIASLSVSPTAPTVLDAIVASFTTSDPDPADTVTVAWTWTIGGVVDPGSITPTLTAGRARKHQSVFVSATPSDGESTGVTTSSLPIDVINSPPSLVDVAIATPLTKASGASCSASGAYDADGDPVSVFYSWEISGLPGPGGTPMDGFFYGRGDVVVCRASPSDGERFGSTLVSAPVTVLNSKPTLAAVVLSDDPVRETSLLATNLIGTSDGDNDILTPSYEWLVNGVVVSTQSLLDGSYFVRGDTVQARVLLSDGFEFSDPVLSPLATVANAVPRVTNVPSLTPNPALTDSVITAVVNTTDPDGDAVTLRWEWYVNGSLRRNGSTATLDGSYFGRNDTVYAIVYPNDGQAEGVGVRTDTASVGNSRPSVPSVSISPAHPTPQVDPVVCSIANPSVDPDADPLTYVFVWKIDGVQTGSAVTNGTTSTLPATSVDASSLIFCEAYATDGGLSSANSAAAIASAGVGIREDCKVLKSLGENTSGYYVVDDDGPSGAAPPYEVYCDQSFQQGGWTRVIRTEGYDVDFGQGAYAIVSAFESAHASQGVYEAFGAYRKWEDVMIRAVSGPQAGGYRVFKAYAQGLTMLEVLETCRDEPVQLGNDTIFDGERTAGHTSRYTSRSYGGDLTIQRAAGGAPVAADFLFVCGVNTASDNDVAYLSFSDSIGSESDWGDAWRTQGQIGTLWSFANGNYGVAGDHHIGNGAMQGYAGWKGAVGSLAAGWHAGTYEIYLR